MYLVSWHYHLSSFSKWCTKLKIHNFSENHVLTSIKSHFIKCSVAGEQAVITHSTLHVKRSGLWFVLTLMRLVFLCSVSAHSTKLPCGKSATPRLSVFSIQTKETRWIETAAWPSRQLVFPPTQFSHRHYYYSTKSIHQLSITAPPSLRVAVVAGANPSCFRVKAGLQPGNEKNKTEAAATYKKMKINSFVNRFRLIISVVQQLPPVATSELQCICCIVSRVCFPSDRR